MDDQNQDLVQQEVPEPEEAEEPKEEYIPRPLGFRIFALVLAILVIIGTILYYYNIFTAK